MPLTLFWQTLGRYARLVPIALSPRRGRLAGRSVRHYVVSVLLLALLPLYLAYHWLGLLLDEVFFRGYRRVRIVEPVFIVGVPRSGTSALHATLAEDGRFTTFRTWECLFAVSVTWRRFWWAAAALDRRLGRPGARLLAAAERRAFGAFDATHPMTLQSPEEDHFVFMPLLYCFILVAAFPDAPWLWRFGRLDEAVAPAERRRLLAFYRGCVQRHLYAHATDRRFLSKNPTFSPLVAALARSFPDARFLCCLREPREAVSSQLSVLHGPMTAIHGSYRVAAFQKRLAEQLAHYYEHLLAVLNRLPQQRAVFIPAPALRGQLRGTVIATYEALAMPLDTAFSTRLVELDARARAGQSAHRHALADSTLDEAWLRNRLAHVHQRFDFNSKQPAPAGHAPERLRSSA
ncbi:sulfotransferase [Ectothiorhodospiraceae bacterium WFHF3C12]|nr:sulfotransferase [Ectothiorhodospiraceae bacterium WFHF3C12]